MLMRSCSHLWCVVVRGDGPLHIRWKPETDTVPPSHTLYHLGETIDDDVFRPPPCAVPWLGPTAEPVNLLGSHRTLRPATLGHVLHVDHVGIRGLHPCEAALSHRLVRLGPRHPTIEQRDQTTLGSGDGFYGRDNVVLRCRGVIVDVWSHRVLHILDHAFEVVEEAL